MNRYGIVVCISISALMHAQFELGDEPKFYARPERADVDVYQAAYDESLRGSRDIAVLERMQQEEEAAREEREGAYETGWREKPLTTIYVSQEVPAYSSEEAQAYTPKKSEEAVRQERLKEKARTIASYEGRCTPPHIREAEERAAREEKESAYSQYYSELSAQQRAQEEARYEQKFQEFEQMAMQAYEEAKEIVAKERQAAQALRNIIRSAEFQAKFEEQLAEAAEKAERIAGRLEMLMKETAEKGERAERIAAAKEQEKELEDASQLAREGVVALQRIIKSAEYQAIFDDAIIRRDIELAEQQLQEARILIKKKERAAELQAKFEENLVAFDEARQRAQAEINKSYPKRAVRWLGEMKDSIQRMKKEVVDPKLQQSADYTIGLISQAVDTVDKNLPWKTQMMSASKAAKDWYNMAGAWITARAGVGSLNEWMAAHAGIVAPDAGRDVGPQWRTSGALTDAEKVTVSAYVDGYRRAVKEYEALKKQIAPVSQAVVNDVIRRFRAIQTLLNENPQLKAKVTARIVPLLVRTWRGKEVLIEYIDDYIKKLENIFATAQLRQRFVA